MIAIFSMKKLVCVGSVKSAWNRMVVRVKYTTRTRAEIRVLYPSINPSPAAMSMRIARRVTMPGAGTCAAATRPVVVDKFSKSKIPLQKKNPPTRMRPTKGP